MRRKVDRWLNRRGYYRVDQLRVGANCGCCGKHVPNEIVEDVWPWTLCRECIGYPEGYLVIPD
jgi:hypothetical protein